MKLNEKRLRGKEELRLGVKYVLPPLKKGTSASVSPKAVAGKREWFANGCSGRSWPM